jgi:hypothetical protein
MSESVPDIQPCRVLLIGMMGSGKTTIGRLLSERTGWPYHDNDDLLRAAAGRSARELLEHEDLATLRHVQPDPRVAGCRVTRIGHGTGEPMRRLLARRLRYGWRGPHERQDLQPVRTDRLARVSAHLRWPARMHHGHCLPRSHAAAGGHPT